MKNFTKFFIIFAMSCALLMAVGCSKSSDDDSSDSPTVSSNNTTSGGGSGIVDPTSVQLSGKISTVDPKETSTRAINTGNFSSDSDYAKDKVDVWVRDEAGEALKIANEIICSVKQTKFQEFVNAGDYNAQIDTSLCKDTSEKGQEKGTSTSDSGNSSSQPEYEMWVVNSSHAGAGEPVIVRFWISDEGDGDRSMPQMIKAELKISESASDENPLGRFKLTFGGYPMMNGVVDDTADMKGVMYTATADSGELLLKFSLKQGHDNFEWVQQLVISRDKANDSGKGISRFSSFENCQCNPHEDGCNCGGIKNVSFDYNANFVAGMNTDDNKTTCFDRNNPHVSVWSYGLYDSTGKRVKRNSGFSIKSTSGDKEFHGWVGYHGLWMPEEANITNGSTVEKMEWNNNGSSGEQYEVFMAGGRLEKHTRKNMTLNDIKNIPLSWHSCDETSCQEYRVVWNGTSLVKDGYRNEETQYMWQDLTTPETVTFSEYDWNFHFWSEALGGSGMIEIRDHMNQMITISSTTKVIFHIVEMVAPGDTIPATLTCYNECPDPSKLSDMNPYFGDMHNWDPENITAYDYTFNTSTMELNYDGTAIVLNTQGQNQWGIHTGALFENTSENLDALKCDWDDTKICPWKAWTALSVYYTWNTGPDQWNKFTTIKNITTGDFETFEQPLNLKYTHNKTGSEFDGVTFYLNYEGFGNLHGMPHVCINPETGEEANCDENAHWVPLLHLPDGSLLTSADTVAAEYVVKGLQKEQRMKKVDMTNCTDAGLDANVSYEYPEDSELVPPEIGDIPEVTDAPAVIGGVVQSE